MLSEIKQFVNWVRRRNPDARTWRDYGYDLHLFIQVVGDHSPDEITYQDIDRFVAAQCDRGYKATTINRRLAAVVSLYLFLSYEDEDLVCPVLPRRHYLREPQRLPRPVGTEDIGKFFAVIENVRDRAMFLLMLRCGLRISEVARLRLVDLYLDERYPRLVVSGKGGRERSVYLSSQAERSLRSWVAERPSVACDFVFLSYLQNGLSTTAIHKRLMRYRDQAGLNITAHRLRHSFGRPFGRLINVSLDTTRCQERVFSPWRFREPSISGLVSFQGT